MKDTKVAGAIKHGRAKEELDMMIDTGVSAGEAHLSVYETSMGVLRG